MKKEFFQEIEIPEDVEISLNKGEIKVKGTQGEEKRNFKTGKLVFEVKDKKIVIGDKKVISKDYDYVDFSRIKIRGRGDLFLTQGDSYSVKIEAEEDIIDSIGILVEEDVLVIEEEKILFNTSPIEIYVTMPDVNSITMEGSGDIKGENKINTEKLDVIIMGSSDILLDVKTEELKKYNFRHGDSENFVNYPLSIKDVRFSALFIEKKDHVKISFRSKGNFPVNEFAVKHFNGGGHLNAAGGESHTTMNDTLQKFKDLLPEYKDGLLSDEV